MYNLKLFYRTLTNITQEHSNLHFTIDKMTIDKMTIDKKTIDKMTIDKMTIDKMSVDKMSVDKKTRCQIKMTNTVEKQF